MTRWEATYQLVHRVHLRALLNHGAPMHLTVYESVTATILSALERGVVPWRKPWSSDHPLPVNAMSNRAYRGVNVFLLALSPYTDHRWLTFKQVQARGGSVKRCERATMVIFWTRWQPSVDDSDSDANPATSAKEIPLLRYYQVFNVEQCEGLGFPEPHRSQAREHERIERAELLVRLMEDTPTIREGGSSAWYKPAHDLVQVPPLSRFTSPDDYYATLFHELGHATGHPSRLNRTGVAETARFGSSTYSKEELVAELTAAFCCALVGLDNSVIDDATSYIQGWLRLLNADPKACVIAAAQAQKAADYIAGVRYTNEANSPSAVTSA